MTNKLDRLPSAQAAFPTGRTESAAPAAKPETVSAPATTQAAPRGTRSQFADATPDAVPLQAKGSHVGRSASADSLWGSSGPKPQRGIDRAALMAMSPAERREKFSELRAQRDQLRGEITGRRDELRNKWRHADVETKAAALEAYANGGSEALDARTQAKLSRLSDRAERHRERLERVKAELESVASKSPEGKELAAEVKKIEAQLTKEIDAAVAIVTKSGLEVDALAHTEQIIDESAPPPASDDSLLGKITSFFKLDSLFGFLIDLVRSELKRTNDMQSKQVEERMADEVRDRQRLVQQAQLRMLSEQGEKAKALEKAATSE